MQARKLNTQRRSDVRKFINFPFTLYKDCPQWVPPLVSGVRKTLNREKHPFYRHSDADFFLVEDDDRVLGRIAVLANQHYNDYHNSNVAFFHYFDAVDDVEVARALFDAAKTWAQERGLDTIIGPKGFLRSDGMGLLIKGYEYRTVIGIPYNYPYYTRLVEAVGFTKEIDYHSGYLEGDYELPARFERIAERVKERRGFWVKSFKNKRELREWVPRIQEVNNQAFPEVWGYYPLDDGETEMISQQLLTVADPKLMKVVMHGDEVAGFAFIYPDVSAALQASRGRIWPFGWIRLLIALKTTRELSGNGVGMLPKYQGLGANAVLYTELVKTVKKRGADFCDVAQAAENNAKSLGDMAAIQVNWYKYHRIYRLDLDV